MTDEEQFRRVRGVFVPSLGQFHRSDDYDEGHLELLVEMQREHFWYRGRHKLLLRVLRREILQRFGQATDLRAIDLGGGCGGWLEYIHAHDATMFHQLALGDSSLRALSQAEALVGSFATRFQVDLLDLPWIEEWDVAFLLDVLEHIPDHLEALRQTARAIRPGGLLFVTAPALESFWTYNDDLAQHQRRYRRQDFRILAEQAGLELLRADYFMFFLSPALLLSRMFFRPPRSATLEQRREHLARTHRVPTPAVNELLAGIFSIEAAMVNAVRFPWGTSVLAVFRR